MKRKSKKQIFDGYYKHITGKPVDKDIRTKPDVKTGKPEQVVLKECLDWLKKNRVMARRNNVGFGDLHGTGQSYHYGIKDAGDIICHLNGRYCEIECKHGNGGIWKLNQQKHARKVTESGGLYFIVHSVDELKDAVMPFLKKEFSPFTKSPGSQEAGGLLF